MVSTHDALMRGTLHFPNLIKLNDIMNDFRYELEIYGMVSWIYELFSLYLLWFINRKRSFKSIFESIWVCLCLLETKVLKNRVWKNSIIKHKFFIILVSFILLFYECWCCFFFGYSKSTETMFDNQPRKRRSSSPVLSLKVSLKNRFYFIIRLCVQFMYLERIFFFLLFQNVVFVVAKLRGMAHITAFNAIM